MLLVRIPAPLRSFTKGSAQVHAEGHTIAELVDDLERQFPGVRGRRVDEAGALRPFVGIYVNDENTRYLDGIKTLVKGGDEVSIMAAISGGA